MKIIYPGAISVLHDAVAAANKLLVDPAFYDAIAQKPSFAASGATGAQVAASMQRCDLALTVKTYKNPLSRALGYENPHDPTSIFINIAGNKLSRSVGSIAATFIHEAVHAADADDESIEYAHRGNRPAGNEDTAPYWIGDLAARMIDAPQLKLADIITAMSLATAVLPDTECAQIEDENLPPSGPNFTLSVRVMGQEQTPLPMNAYINDLNVPPGNVSIRMLPAGIKNCFDWLLFLPAGDYLLHLTGQSNPDGYVEAKIQSEHFAYEPPILSMRSDDNGEIRMRFPFSIR